MTTPPNRRTTGIPAQRQAIDGCTLKRRFLVSECLDLMRELALASPEVKPWHGNFFPVDGHRLGRPLAEVLDDLRPLELRGLHARLTGQAVRTLAASGVEADASSEPAA